MSEFLNGNYESITDDTLFVINNENPLKNIKSIKEFFDEWKNSLSEKEFKVIQTYGDSESNQSVSWKISGVHSGVFQGFLPTNQYLTFTGVTNVERENNTIKSIQVFFDKKTIEDQICPLPWYEIEQKETLHHFTGKGRKIYELIASSRNGKNIDSKFHLIHALRKGMLRAPDMSLLDHQEIKSIKEKTQLTKKMITLESNQEIEVLIYTPEGYNENDLLPTVLYLHGGGWCIGSPENYDLSNRKLAMTAGVRVICPRYRLSPEYPYPAGFEDCCHVYEYLLKENHHKKIFVAGDSVGGGFAAALILKMHDDNKPLPDGALFLSPATDMRLENYSSYNLFSKNNIMIDQGLIGLIRGAYVEGDFWDLPYVSPMRGNLSCFPKTFIMIGAEDPLYDENWCFVNKIAKESGRKPCVVIGEEMPHHYHTFIGLSEEVDKAYDAMNNFIKNTLCT